MALATLGLTAVFAASTAFAAGGGGGGGGIGGGGAEEPTGSRAYEKIARKKYERGRRYIEGAVKLEKEAVDAPERRQQLLDASKREYERALRQFDSAISRQSDMHEVHSDRGFVLRKLGDHEGALDAYDTALGLEADYAPAIEYRGEAYLELGRLEDAKQAYLSLVVPEPALARLLLSKMKAWLARQRAANEGHDPAEVEALGAWVEERARIARAMPLEDDASADAASWSW